MKKAGLFHLGQQRLIDQVDPDITFPENIHFPFDDQVANPLHPFGVDVEGIIEKEYDLNTVSFYQPLDLVDHILRASHPDMAPPVDRGGAEIAFERTTPAAHDVYGEELPLSWNWKFEIVILEGDEMKGRVGEAVQILYQRACRVALYLAVYPVGYARNRVQRLEVLSLLMPPAELGHGLLTLSPDDKV